MALGVPVVALKASGLEDFIVHDKTGWLVESRSPETLCAEICLRLDNTSELDRVSKAGRLLIRDCYDWTNTVATFDQILS